MRRLPPLTSLRAFEAAARRQSIKAAAEELCVTASAISHQIDKLEKYLGVSLFHRFNRRVLLTDIGAIYLMKIGTSFDAVEQATLDLPIARNESMLNFAVPPSLLHGWLIPRIARFQAAYPDVTLKVSDTLRPINFGEENMLAAIYYGYGDWPTFHVEHLADERLVPVCSPQFMALHAPKELADLKHCPLIHCERRMVGWPNILREALIKPVDGNRDLHFFHSMHAVRAAQAGLGIALVNWLNVADHVTDGSLCIPFELPAPDYQVPGYFFVCPMPNISMPGLVALRKWIKAELISTLVSPPSK